MLVGRAAFGTTWVSRADPFEVHFTLVGHLSPWSRSTAGRLVLVGPLRNLARIEPEAGLVAVVAVLLSSTAYDSWSNSTTSIRFVQSNTVDLTLLGTSLMTAIILVFGITSPQPAWPRGSTRGELHAATCAGDWPTRSCRSSSAT